MVTHSDFNRGLFFLCFTAAAGAATEPLTYEEQTILVGGTRHARHHTYQNPDPPRRDRLYIQRRYARFVVVGQGS